MQTLRIDQLLYSQYVKYEQLKSLVAQNYQGSEATEINLVLDISNAVRSVLHGPNIEYSDSLFVSGVINMCAHYREFFKNIGVYAHIYIIYTTADDSVLPNKKYIKEYTIHGGKKIIAENRAMLESGLNMLKLLVQYLPNIYLKSTPNAEAGVIVPHILSSIPNPTLPILIVSKDSYVWQLVENGKHDISVLKPVKSRNNGVSTDNSFIVNANNAITHFVVEQTNKYEQNYEIHGEVLSLLMALTRLPRRNVKSMISIPMAVRLLQGLKNNNLILDSERYEVLSIPFLVSTLNTFMTSNRSEFAGSGHPIDSMILEYRFKAIDLFTQYTLDHPTIVDNPANLYDPEAVKSINNEYFKSTPLHLDSL